MPFSRTIPSHAFLALAIAAGCGDADQRRPGGPEHPLLVVGWDGATFDLLDPLMSAGRLPNLRGLLESGSSARLESTIIPISSAAWVAATTGKGPGATGVYSFFEPVEDSYDVRLVSSRSNRADPIWRILTRRGLHANVIGVPLTFPPEPVFGTMIAGMLSPFDGEYAWPAGKADELRARGFVPDLGIWRQTTLPNPKLVDEQLAVKEAVVLEELAGRDWDFSMVVFKSLDVVSHQVYDSRVDGPVAQLAERLDAILGRMIEAAGPNTNVIVMSDHGFRTYPRALNLHRWLVDAGFASESGERSGPPPPGALAETRVVEHGQRLAQLDLDRTRAFATACEGNFGSLRLNLAGREPRGAVDADSAENTLEEIEERLRSLRFLGDDTPLVQRVWRGAELYPGPEGAVVPDLLIEVAPDVQVVAHPTRPTFSNNPRPFPDHARDGILVMAGPSVARTSARGAASVLDVAPTALHLLEQPVYAEMTGVVRAELLSLDSEPRVLREADDPTRTAETEDGGTYTPEDLEEVESRLRSLGYVE